MSEIESIPSKKNLVIKEKFEERYRKLLGDKYEEFLEYSTSYARKSIRVNTLKKSVKEVEASLGKTWHLTRVPWCPVGLWIDHKGVDDEKRFDIGNTLEHVLGYVYVQDAASMIPPVVLDPKPGETVLDMCASPGSKSSQIAALMQNEGCLIANDMQGERLRALGLNVQRMGMKNTIITQMSGRRFAQANIFFDKVLVDAPCSGTGTIRKAFINLKMWSPNLIKKLVSEQRNLIQAGFDCLKPGGTLVYSTCTLEPEENEGMVSWLLEHNPNAKLQDIDLDIKRSPAVTEFEGQIYHPDVKKTLRIWPQDNNTEGFFISKITKEG